MTAACGVECAMRTRTLRVTLAAAIGALGAAATGPLYLRAQSSDVKADYARALGFRARIDGKVYDSADAPVWLPDGRFWYRTTVKGGAAFVVVDPAAAAKRPLFDHQRLAAALSSAAHASYTATTLPFATLTYKKDPEAIEFGTPRWRCTLTDYVCTHVAGSDGDDAAARGGRQGRGGRPPTSVTSPDGRLEAHIEKFNVVVGPVGETASAAAVTTDGREQEAYTMASLAWSPDSRKLAVYRRTPGYQRTLTLVQSSPSDQLQPKVITRNYRKPGDDRSITISRFSSTWPPGARSRSTTALFPTAYQISRPVWRADSRAFTFEYNQRGHELYRVVDVNAATAQPRVLIDEQPGAFFYYRPAMPGLTGSGRRFRATT